MKSKVIIIFAIIVLAGAGFISYQLLSKASCEQKVEDFRIYAAEHVACETSADCKFMRLSETTCEFHLVGENANQDKLQNMRAIYREKCVNLDKTPIMECINPLENKVKSCKNQRCELKLEQDIENIRECSGKDSYYDSLNCITTFAERSLDSKVCNNISLEDYKWMEENYEEIHDLIEEAKSECLGHFKEN